MPSYLLTLSIGPVQSLIGAARRTRDLWCGSWLLSECSRAAARSLHTAQPGALIFPSPPRPDVDLQPLERPGDTANIANIIRASVTAADTDAVHSLCADAANAARQRLREIGDAVRAGLGANLDATLWDMQLDDLLEIHAVWVESGKPDDASGAASEYAHTSRTLGGLLAARKTTRDFRQTSPSTPAKLQKSSLDGAAETVLVDAGGMGQRSRRALGLSRGEQLDALGVIKRRAGQVEQFTAWPRIAIDPWVETLAAAAPELLEQLNAAHKDLERLSLATPARGNAGLYQAFPFDGQLAYAFRLDAALANDLTDADQAEERRALDVLRGVLGPAAQRIGAPVPYAAILKADGDRMGRLLQQAASEDDSRRISAQLHRFASGVAELVREYRGHAIYAGGDDVLALVPLPQALTCADALARQFATSMAPIADALGVPADARPTLSVGIAIGHIMEPLGQLRDRAERAEALAKRCDNQPERNALAVLLGIRSGGELLWRAQWSDAAAFDTLRTAIDAYRQATLPSRVAYDLRAIDQRRTALTRLGGNVIATAQIEQAMQHADIQRMLAKARQDGGSELISDTLRDWLLHQTEHWPLDKLADTLILARWLSARNATELGER